MKKPKLKVVELKPKDITAMVVSAADALSAAKKRMDEQSLTKAIVIMMDDSGVVAYECGKMRFEDMITAIETAKHLMIRDRYQ